MAAVEEVVYHGTWKITECVTVAGVVEITGIEGTEFILDENGDVSWQVPDEAEPLPFFNCETYEICPAAGVEPALLKFIGTYAGHVVEFKVNISDDLMLLTYEKCCILQCQKVSSGPRKDDKPYSFLNALEHGYFSDVILRADTGKEFKAHSIILKLSAPELDWTAIITPLTGLPEDVLQTTLHYLYAECLPQGLSETTAQKCIKMVGKMPGFVKFGQLCETFLKNTALTQQMKTLVSDIHACADRINDIFGGTAGEEGHETVTLEGTMWSNPAKLCYSFRQALREEAIACAKLIIMCDLFSKRKYELSREERYELMKYVKSRIPIFMKQLLTLLTTIKVHLQALTQNQRTDIAAYLVPEMETILDTMSRFANETKVALEQAISTSANNDKGGAEKGAKPDKPKKGGIGDALGRTLKHALHLKELKKLRHFHDRTSSSFLHLRQKRDNFNMKSQPDKVRSVSQSLIHLVDEFPSFVIRLKEIIFALDEKVTWKEWKYLFKMATSRVSWGLAKVQLNRSALQPMIDEMCDIVRSEQFVASLVTLGLKSPSDNTQQSTSSKDISASSNNKTSKYAQLNCIESLCVSPTAGHSLTAKRALDLFRQGYNTDMIFEVVNLQEGGDIIIDHTANYIEDGAGAESERCSGDVMRRSSEDSLKEVYEIRAHRVIVAAHCDWFRRALLSGMKEAIDRKIVVHDMQPEIFTRFLEALYSSHLDTSGLTTEQLADLMTLCDRYEMDNLKHLCEYELKQHLNEDNALCLLNLADHLNTRHLRDSALNYVITHEEIRKSEIFDDLPDYLKEELEEAIIWQGLEPKRTTARGHNLGTPSSTSSMSEVDELVANIDRGLDLSTSSSSEDLPFVEDASRLESCIQDLMVILGDSTPREELTRIALAADYDINRALNFFFAS
ncbi:CAunnamed protein product [Biomphalaria glabrata]|uniref:BTB domain-containing protein n=1 Tax=Biomphalaria glabrata TaxID=6526 RepID=A0A2C9LMV9_BIOGL|nr:CAunnamed protein product [Biomphalaria glabrata]